MRFAILHQIYADEYEMHLSKRKDSSIRTRMGCDNLSVYGSYLLFRRHISLECKRKDEYLTEASGYVIEPGWRFLRFSEPMWYSKRGL